MARYVLSLLAVTASLSAQNDVREDVGQMLMIGFYGTQAPKNSAICRDIRTYDIGGVILFDKNPVDASRPKNIRSKAQVARLTRQLQACSPNHDLLIAVDQEGGRVQRLKAAYGFAAYPSAADIAARHPRTAKATYHQMAHELHEVGVNYNLAPVVDLALNPRNHVIYKLKRSFGSDPVRVAAYAESFIDAMHRYGIAVSLKHFPGHGSSLGDTHKGFVDVTDLWQKKELAPYRMLAHKADSVMVAHVFNRRLDPRYPATLSSRIVNGLLRNKLGFDGVCITDDLQMGAIAKHYSLKETIRLAVKAGNDILLFGNQIDPKRTYSAKKLVGILRDMIAQGTLSKQRIQASLTRIKRLKARVRDNAPK